jgi:metacaspase-1
MNYGLCVGVNRYKMAGNDLSGCVNDVFNMTALLTKCCDFSVMAVKTLTNENATKKNIIDRLTQMVSAAKQGDHLVFHFSGHGSQVPDTEGDESDGLDEVICPYDFDWNGSYIRDDDLRRICETLDGGATLDVILDCCHSGTGLREIGDPVAKCIPYEGPIPKTPVFTRMLQDHDFPNVALWAGCKDDQTSADAFINNQHQGAMTWAFTEVLRWKNFRRDETIRDIRVNMTKWDQDPQLECCDSMKERKVFE